MDVYSYAQWVLYKENVKYDLFFPSLSNYEYS